MNSTHKTLTACLLGALFATPLVLLADVDGADPRLTGAPGESNCTSCHTGTSLNGGGGGVKIVLPNGNNYSPGVKQRVQVQVSDPAQRRWGFELSARVGTGTSQAGTLATVDSNTRIRTTGGVQYITHTLAGTRLGTTGGATFEFDWTPPASDVGNVTLYAAGNAANGNNQDTGDHIYTTNVSVAPAAATDANKPTISSTSGVVNGASFQAGIAPRSWITIAGTNLAKTTRLWSSSDFNNGELPTSLDGVSVTVNGKPAYVEYVSPTQVNVVAPADDARGNVEVKVTVDGQTSDARLAMLQDFSPAFFTFDGKYLAATHADNFLLGKNGLFASAPNATTPAKPGETIVLYATGFGSTNPSVPASQITTALASITNNYTIRIGGLPANVIFGGLVPPYAQLYQFNVTIPEAVGDGDQAVVAEIGGVSSPAGSGCCFITVER